MQKRMELGVVIGWIWLVTASIAAAAVCRDSFLVEHDCGNGRTACRSLQCGFCLDDGPEGSGSEADCDSCCTTFNTTPGDIELCEETSCRA